MQSKAKRVVILATGGTIAGASRDPAKPATYTAGLLTAEALVQAVPALAEAPLDLEQLASIDSKDMSFALWRSLAERVAHHLEDPEVAGIVITHGTDTLEETAYFLQRLLAPPKPVVLTAAMHPADALLADGPQNLLDAVHVASAPGARGVLVAVAGRVYAGAEVRKAHTWRLDSFEAGDNGPVALMRHGRLQHLRDWPDGAAVGLDALPRTDEEWPWVEIVLNTAGTSGAAVRAMVRAGVQGLVAAGTGNGTLHVDLGEALLQARKEGVAVLRCSRCASGGVLDPDDRNELPTHDGPSHELTAVHARVELMLELMLKSKLVTADLDELPVAP